MRSSSILRPLTALALTAALAAGCSAPESAPAPEDGSIADNVVSFEEYLERAVTAYDAATDTYTLEGDLPAHGIEEARAVYERSMTQQAGALTVVNNSGSRNLWNSTDRLNLTYCVDSSWSYHDQIVSALEEATGAWEAAIPVHFIHDTSQDGNCNASNPNVMFDVRYGGSSSTVVAKSFFPNGSRADRTLYVLDIGLGYFNGDRDRIVGTLKHELGHILGFIHEHVWIGCNSESAYSNYEQLTPYDDRSVMHYAWCISETSNWRYTISPLDAQGAQAAYGSKTFNVLELNNHVELKGDLTNLIVGDFNGDGKDDFIRQEKGGWDDDNVYTAHVFLSNGTGTFTMIQPNSFDELKGDLTNLIVGDFNGDGKDDFIRQEKGGWDDDNVYTAHVWLSNGNGTFTIVAPYAYDTLKGDLTNLYVGDFNGDGRDDFLRQEKGAWDDDSNGTANVWLSNGNGTFTVVTPNSADDLKGDFTNIYIGDFNGDGRDDFLRQEKGAWDDDSNGTANVWLSNGNGTFTVVTPNSADDLKGDLTNIYVGDFNGDGRDDFLRQEKAGWDDDDLNTANVWLSNGNGTFTIVTPNSSDTLKGDFTKLTVGDFNGDGKDDFVRQEKGAWADDSVNTASVWLSNGNGNFTITALPVEGSLKADPTSLICGDFNGDGKVDFIRQEKNGDDDDTRYTAEVFYSVL